MLEIKSLLPSLFVLGLLGAVTPIGGSSLQRLTPATVVDLAGKRNSDAYSGFSWIPGTHAIVYSQEQDPREGSWIYEISITDGIKRRFFSGENPAPSPDGRTIAFIRPSDTHAAQKEVWTSGRQIWLADVTGHDVHQITHLQKGICDLDTTVAWSPDTQHILYLTCVFYDSFGSPKPPSPSLPTVEVALGKQKWRYGLFTLHMFDLSNGKDSVLVQQQGEFGRFAWIDANTVLYEHDNGATGTERGRAELSTISISDKRSRVLVSGYNFQTYYHPVINLAKKLVAFRADPTERTLYPARNEIGIFNLRSHFVHLLPFTSNAVPSQMSWTADGRWLLYSDGPSTRLELVGTDGVTVPRQLTFGGGGNFNAAFSSDSTYIAWLHDNALGTTSLRMGRWMDGRITLSRDIATLSNPLVNIVSGETTALHWKSFDGLAIDGYLTLPVQRKRGPYPLVVILHGGPARVRNSVDTVEWPGGIYFVELLAQRGFAVFEPDYRASGNFGFKFILQERARQDPFKENFADIASGITMLEKRGIADPSKLYLLGHSYGSTETNWIITHDTRFRAAISYEGLDYFYDWSRLGVPDTNMGWWLGDSSPLTQPKVWAANSAVLSTAHVSTPTLFIATEKGINSPSMLWLSGALLSKGIDTQYLLYRGEPHVIIQPANQRDLIQRILRWLKEH